MGQLVQCCIVNNDCLYLSLFGTQKFESYFFSLTDQLIMQWPQSATLTKQKLTHYINRGFLTGHQAAETAKKLWFTDVLYQFKILTKPETCQVYLKNFENHKNWQFYCKIVLAQFIWSAKFSNVFVYFNIAILTYAMLTLALCVLTLVC